MEPDQNRVVVTEGVCSDYRTFYCTHAHHRDFPEIQAEGDSVVNAATHLINKLVGVLDSAVDHEHRDAVEHAIADIKALAERATDDFAHRPCSPVASELPLKL